jgi:hypothetical protein
MAGLDPAIHVFELAHAEDVDARHEAGHADIESAQRLKIRPLSATS